MGAEILVYIQKVKNYLETNEEARTYFIGNSDVTEFFKHLEIISTKNFNDNGEPELTKEQFELLRKTMAAVAISNEKFYYSDDKSFLFIDGYELPISMN